MAHAWYRLFPADEEGRCTENPDEVKEIWDDDDHYVEAWPIRCGNCGAHAFVRCWYELDGFAGYRDNGEVIREAEGPFAAKDWVNQKRDIVTSRENQTAPGGCI